MSDGLAILGGSTVYCPEFDCVNAWDVYLR